MPDGSSDKNFAEITSCDVPDGYEYCSVLVEDINEVLEEFEELSWGVEDKVMVYLIGTIVYEDVCSRKEPICFEVKVVFPRTYPFEEPAIYLPKYRDARYQFVSKEGRLNLLLDVPWISSPVLLDLIERAISQLEDNISNSSISFPQCCEFSKSEGNHNMTLVTDLGNQFLSNSRDMRNCLSESAKVSTVPSVNCSRSNFSRIDITAATSINGTTDTGADKGVDTGADTLCNTSNKIERETLQKSGAPLCLDHELLQLIQEEHNNYILSVHDDINVLSKRQRDLKDENCSLLHELSQVEADVRSCFYEIQEAQLHQEELLDTPKFQLNENGIENISNDSSCEVASKVIKALDDSIDMLLKAFETRKINLTDFIYYTRYIAKQKFSEVCKLKKITL